MVLKIVCIHSRIGFQLIYSHENYKTPQGVSDVHRTTHKTRSLYVGSVQGRGKAREKEIQTFVKWVIRFIEPFSIPVWDETFLLRCLHFKKIKFKMGRGLVKKKFKLASYKASPFLKSRKVLCKSCSSSFSFTRDLHSPIINQRIQITVKKLCICFSGGSSDQYPRHTHFTPQSLINYTPGAIKIKKNI